MKRLTLALTVFCLVLAPLSVAHAQSNDDAVRISLLYSPDTVYVSTNDYIVLHHGWAACTRGLVNMYLSAVHDQLGINGETVYVADGKDQYWSSSKYGTRWPSCMGKSGQDAWVARWNYPLGALPPGEYEVNYTSWFDHPILDGGDYDGDGRPDIWWDGLPFERTFTIVVE